MLDVVLVSCQTLAPLYYTHQASPAHFLLIKKEQSLKLLQQN